jgi:hypothetical protein
MIALAQAKRANLGLEVLSHDAVAREWRIKLAGDELVIRESARDGRTREAKPADQVTVDDVVQARRYAAAARELRPLLEAQVKRVVEAERDFVTDVVELGHGFGGVMNRDTRFEHGTPGDPRSHLVVYEHDGAMTNRGALPSGQIPDHQTMPGVRTREHTTQQGAYTQSQDLGDATEVGRLETQTAAYRARVVSIERRDHLNSGNWSHTDRPLRSQVIANGDSPRWIYSNWFDNAGGMGPTNFTPVMDKLGATPEAQHEVLAEMRAKDRLLAGDDPDLSSKFHAGETVFVWGGSPTGAWAGEDAAMHGAKVHVVGESSKLGTPGRPEPGTAREFEAKLRRAGETGDAAEMARLLEQRVAETHSGSSLRRNQQPSATYGADARQRGIHVEVGVPTKMELQPDGRVKVTIGIGQQPGVRVFDRVVMALGQNPHDPGGPAALLGRGAETPDADVPAGTIALRMVRDKEGRLVALESVDGLVRLVGAAYASDKLARWVIPGERALFKQLVSEIAKVGETTHTGAKISADSPGVTTGIEAQRDRVPVANEVLAARDYRLPNSIAADRLSLPADRPEVWAERLEDYLTKSMRGRPGRVKVTLLQTRDGVRLFHVMNGAEEVGVVRVYDSEQHAQLEAQVTSDVKAAVPTLDVGTDRGTSSVGGGNALRLSSHAREATHARGASFDDLSSIWKHAGDNDKASARKRLDAAVTRTAQTLAELHNAFAHDGVLMTALDKQHKVAATKATLASSDIARTLGADEVSKIRAKLQPIEDAFMKARIPAAAELGDAGAAAFRYNDYKGDHSFGSVSVAEVGAVAGTLDLVSHAARGAGAADVAQFLESIRRNPDLDGVVGELEKHFLDTYTKTLKNTPSHDLGAALAWYRISGEIDAVARGEPGAAARLTSLIGTTP